jgi:hypothetical protein
LSEHREKVGFSPPRDTSSWTVRTGLLWRSGCQVDFFDLNGLLPDLPSVGLSERHLRLFLLSKGRPKAA